MNVYLSGALTMAYFVVGLFFRRFWKKTRDRLFAYFSAAFFILAMERVVGQIDRVQETAGPWVFISRILAFGLILTAIIQKNREEGKGK